MSGAPEPHMGLFSGITMIVGLIIGSGVFASPGPLFVQAGSVSMALIVWLVAGLLSMLGAFCYAELGTLITKSGGEYQYLKSGFGSLMGVIYTWSNVMLINPIGTASIAVVFARYLLTLVYFRPSMDPDNMPIPPTYQLKLVACGGILLITLINCVSQRSGNMVQNVFTMAKLLAIAIIVVIGLVWLGKGHVENFEHGFKDSSTKPLEYGTAMYLALFAYNGWNNLNYATGELKNPRRNLPLAITISCIVVIACYELANVAYFAVLPISVVRTSETVAMQLGLRTMGAFGGYFMAAMVVCSTFGAMNGNMWAASRLIVANAEEGTVFPKGLGHIHATRQSPVRAWILVAIMSMLLTLPGDFTYLASIYAFLLWIFYFLTVVALLVLRRKMADSPRPFKIWWPLACLFLIVAGYLVVAPLIGTASDAGVYVGCVVACLIGVPIWYFRVRNPQLLSRIVSRLPFCGRRAAANATAPIVAN
ncbi:amino acid/polyamine transporter I [Syncephalis pseudoplumigaleata]|uniref:Amino acid/polyamine transporter I n=1 Tax=Syncephalis pseudoplumigaleata TaxID=1712513 RepID=A0A4P9Z668_9FUNG|nr:amino acid/polyamine transporter I [Syncephalis pseudoplumigaleata]|eukprot:RKP27150.1 amino acid/polyamine transporter I [Syncephalis pseudoplumigaleata]